MAQKREKEGSEGTRTPTTTAKQLVLPPPKMPPWDEIRSKWPEALRTLGQPQVEADEHLLDKDDNWKELTARIVLVMRTAERVDRVLGPDWLSSESFGGKLLPTDANVPSSLKKLLSLENLGRDPPITSIGKYTTQLLADALRRRRLTPGLIFASPALRCVQTALAVAERLNLSVCVEPGLFEPLGWYQGEQNGDSFAELPIQFVYSHLQDVSIDKTYNPLVHMNYLWNLAGSETEGQARQRIAFVLRMLATKSRQGPLLVVGHAVCLELASFMQGRPDRLNEDFTEEEIDWDEAAPVHSTPAELGTRYPPGALVGLIQSIATPYTYKRVEGLVPPLTLHTGFSTRALHDETSQDSVDHRLHA